MCATRTACVCVTHLGSVCETQARVCVCVKETQARGCLWQMVLVLVGGVCECG